MSGPIKMYAMRQIVRHDVAVELPTCMYRLHNIHRRSADTPTSDSKSKNGTADVSSPSRDRQPTDGVELITEQATQNCSAMDLLQERQEVILGQLKDLEKQIEDIRSTLHSDPVASAPPAPVKPKVQASKNMNVSQLPSEISINANPSNPPYSLLLLQKYWREWVNIDLEVYTHSNVSKLPVNAQEFMLSVSERASSTPGLPTVTIRLIWKSSCNQMELAGPRTLNGEVNILRYLARITRSLNYDESDYNIDALLDLCDGIIRSSNKTARIPMLQRLHKKLGKNMYIFDDYSIVDIAAYSAIKQVAGANEVNVNLTKWMANCESA